MTWSTRRQLTYFFSFIVIVAGITSLLVYNATKVEPTCYDGKQNSNEVGVDCGGVCAFYCKDELDAPKVRWVRFFPIAQGIVHAVAYIEHSYPTAGAERVSYEFKLYDEKNNLITTREGTSYIGPMGKSALVETLIPIGNNTPFIARFSFTDTILWEKIPAIYAQIGINTDRYVLESFGDGLPDQEGTRLTVTLENESRTTFENMDVVALLYDTNDNAIAVSKSLLETLPGQGSATMYFTWPTALKERTARVELIPRINPFSTKEL